MSSPLETEQPQQSLQEALRRLLAALEPTEGIRIALAVLDAPQPDRLRTLIMAQVAARLGLEYRIHEFNYLETPILSLPRFARTLASDGLNCIVAYGLELLQDAAPERYQEAIKLLNTQREDLRDAQSALILWMSPATYADVLRDAPDFSDWQSVSLRLSWDATDRAEISGLVGLSIRDIRQLRRLETRLEAMLTRPNLDPAMAAELNRQLADTRKQLGEEQRGNQALEAAVQGYIQTNDRRRLEDLYRAQVAERLEHLSVPGMPFLPTLLLDLETHFIPTRLTHHEERTRESVDPVASSGSKEANVRPAHIPHIRRNTHPLQNGVPSQGNLKALFGGEQLGIILGAPGSGKTTLLRYIALLFARPPHQRAHLGVEEELIPFYVQLPSLQQHFLRATTRNSAIKGKNTAFLISLEATFRSDVARLDLPPRFLQRLLEQGRCVLLLDSLDEVGDVNQRRSLCSSLNHFLSDFPGVRVLLSSRAEGFQEGSSLTCPSSLWTLGDFDRTMVTRFVQARYRAIYRAMLGETQTAWEKAEAQSADLLRAIEASTQLQEIAVRPLLLGALITIHQRGLGLPVHRAALYDECTRLLLGNWDLSKQTHRPPQEGWDELAPDQRRYLLEQVALHVHENTASEAVLDHTQLIGYLTASLHTLTMCTLKTAKKNAAHFLTRVTVRSGLLVRRQDGRYSFIHRGFEEYLAARAIADRPDFLKYCLAHLHQPHWQEVLLLTAAVLSSSDGLERARRQTKDLISAIRSKNSWLEDVLHRDLLFAARCLWECAAYRIDEDLRRGILETLIDLGMDTPYEVHRQEVAEVISAGLSSANGSLIAAALEKRLKVRMVERKCALLRLLRQVKPLKAQPRLYEALLATLSSRHDQVRLVALQALAAQGETYSSRTLQAALEPLLKRRRAELRQAAARVWVRLAPDLAQVFVLTHHAVAEIRAAAIHHLSDQWDRFDPELVRRLELLADPSSEVRRQTVQSLESASQLQNSTRIRDRLWELLRDSCAVVRWRAGVFLLLNGTNGGTPQDEVERTTTRLLELTHDRSAGVRLTAVKLLGPAQWGTADGATVSRLLALTGSRRAELRVAALTALIDVCEGHGLDEVNQRLVALLYDPVAGVREALVSCMARRSFLSDPVWSQVLMLSQDPDPWRRIAYLHVLLFGGHVSRDSSDEIDLARRLMRDPSPLVRCEATGLFLALIGRRKMTTESNIPPWFAAQLQELIHDSDVRVRSMAGRGLLDSVMWGLLDWQEAQATWVDLLTADLAVESKIVVELNQKLRKRGRASRKVLSAMEHFWERHLEVEPDLAFRELQSLARSTWRNAPLDLRSEGPGDPSESPIETGPDSAQVQLS